MRLLRPTSSAAKIGWRSAILILCLAAPAPAATLLPVGPIAFGSNSEFDNRFKESSLLAGGFPTNGLARNASGFLSATNVPTSLAVYDTAATGGSNGLGGTGGGDANNDLSNFTISAEFASSVPGIAGGFLLRLNNSEAGGYVATVRNLAPFQIQFSLFEGASFTSAGFNIFNQVVLLPPPFSVAANTFYEFRLTVNGGNFQFNFANGSAVANFTDLTVSSTIGQVGIIVDTLAPGTTSLMDNFQIRAVPEPSSAALCIVALVAGAASWPRKRRTAAS